MPEPSKNPPLSDAEIRYLRDGGAGLAWIAGATVVVIAVAAVIFGFVNGNTDMSASRNPANLSVPMATNPPAATSGRG